MGEALMPRKRTVRRGTARLLVAMFLLWLAAGGKGLAAEEPMAGVMRSGFLGAAAGGLVGGAVYLLAGADEPERIGTGAALGVLFGVGYGLFQLFSPSDSVIFLVEPDRFTSPLGAREDHLPMIGLTIRHLW